MQKERKEQSQLQARTSMTALEANTDGASTQVIGEMRNMGVPEFNVFGTPEEH